MLHVYTTADRAVSWKVSDPVRHKHPGDSSHNALGEFDQWSRCLGVFDSHGRPRMRNADAEKKWMVIVFIGFMLAFCSLDAVARSFCGFCSIPSHFASMSFWDF